MGDDTDDLIERIESELGVRFASGELAEVRTVGDLATLVKSKLPPRQASDRCLTSHVFYRLREELCRVTEIDRRQVRPNVPMERLIPSNQRRRVWRELTQAGFILPSLTMSSTSFLVILAASMLLAGSLVAGSLGIWRGLDPVAMLVGTGLFFALSILLTGRLARSCRWTVGALSVQMAPNYIRNGYALSGREVETIVSLIVADQLGVKVEDVGPNVRFAEDLNAD